ncbi:MAG: GH92 family glycosyl hydrolase [bacterium]
MMKRQNKSPRILVLFMCLFGTLALAQEKSDYTHYVDPFIGTDGHGHTFPGATVPFGMVQLSPDTDTEGWDWCSGYHYSDSSIMGFSHTHLSGTGASDYGDIRFMPTLGTLTLAAGIKSDPDSGYRSRFNHKHEHASPGYYSVLLDDYNIKAEFTVTKRVGFHKYTYPESKSSHLIIDLAIGIHDQTVNSFIQIANNTEITGFRRSTGWAKNHCFYFVVQFSKPFNEYGISINEKIQKNKKTAQGEDIKAYVTFSTKKNEIVLVKVGISAVSIEGARKNLEKEIPDWNFQAVKSKAEITWNKKLNKIEVYDESETDKTIFYTALYHTMIAPNTFMDIDNKYMGMDDNIHTADGFINHTVFSLWDTFRALHPLFTIIEQKRTSDFIKTMLKKYEQSGLLPVWELAAQETNCMIGYHSIPVIADAYVKGIRDYDIDKAYKAMKTSAEQDQFGLKHYRKYGYIPAQLEHESVSKTLEYSYDDWCIAQMAKELGKTRDYEYFLTRSQSYKNLFDLSVMFMRARKNGKWIEPFDPTSVTGAYTEANSWQYSFFVPHDIAGLIELFNGDTNFTNKLDLLFSHDKTLTGRNQVDITGLIGQYAHGNEPSHHMAYLYNFTQRYWKTQEIVTEITHNLYSAAQDGLCGNEDCGQMSAWYVFSAMGFYPVCPGMDYYVFGSPVFNKIIIHLENGETFKIIVNNLSKSNIYINSLTLNGQDYGKRFITHKDIINGGQLCFTMTDTPNKQLFQSRESYPSSQVGQEFLTSPFFGYDHITFYKEQKVKILHPDENVSIYYTLDGSDPDVGSPVYTEPIVITESTPIKAIAVKGDHKSFPVSVDFTEIPYKRDIELKTDYAPQYSAGGDKALIDHIKGNNNFWSGGWQGYEGVNIEAVINLNNSIKINKISTRFLQNINAWIFMPLKVDYYISEDGNNFRKVGSVKNTVSENKSGIIIKNFTLEIDSKEAQYIKIVAKNRKMCPEWHKGYGGKAWIFADEITIN